MKKVTENYRTVKGKQVLVGKTVVKSKTPKLLNASQRTKIKLAKLNQSTAKSAIGEIGKSVRDIGAQITAAQGYKTYAASKAANRINSQNNSVDAALKLYNQIVNGNPEEKGESGDTSTTQVGGSGSAIGG